MSIAQTEKATKVVAPHATLPRASEIRIYSHSTIFYWWHVWMVGYMMAGITFAEGSRAAIVPAGSDYDEGSHAIALPVATAHPGIAGSEIGDRSAQSKNLGVVFTIILLLVVFITNTPLRGLWSGIAILVILVLTVTFAWLGVWTDVLTAFGRIRIHMNLGFYMFFSSLLFLLWAAVVLVFDGMHYWKFRPAWAPSWPACRRWFRNARSDAFADYKWFRTWRWPASSWSAWKG